MWNVAYDGLLPLLFLPLLKDLCIKSNPLSYNEEFGAVLAALLPNLCCLNDNAFTRARLIDQNPVFTLFNSGFKKDISGSQGQHDEKDIVINMEKSSLPNVIIGNHLDWPHFENFSIEWAREIIAQIEATHNRVKEFLNSQNPSGQESM